MCVNTKKKKSHSESSNEYLMICWSWFASYIPIKSVIPMMASDHIQFTCNLWIENNNHLLNDFCDDCAMCKWTPFSAIFALANHKWISLKINAIYEKWWFWIHLKIPFFSQYCCIAWHQFITKVFFCVVPHVHNVLKEGFFPIFSFFFSLCLSKA